jgi:hypothetical protein
LLLTTLFSPASRPLLSARLLLLGLAVRHPLLSGEPPSPARAFLPGSGAVSSC